MQLDVKERKNAQLIITPSMPHVNVKQLLNNSKLIGTIKVDSEMRIPFVTTAPIVLQRMFGYRLITETWISGCAKRVNCEFIANYIVAIGYI